MAGALGSALTSQASVARILYAMGRDGILPRKVFGHVSARFSTPAYAILVVSIISLLAIVIDLAILASTGQFRCAGGVLGGEPVGDQALLRRCRTNAAPGVLNTRAAGDRLPADRLWLWTSLSGTTLIVGLIWLAIGFLWLLWVTRGFRRPTPVLDLEE